MKGVKSSAEHSWFLHASSGQVERSGRFLFGMVLGAWINMNILIACERSGRVRDAFSAKGHNVISCDFENSDTPGQHYKGDVLDILYQDWDLVIAHPPCTFLTKARGVVNLVELEKAVKFFNLFIEHPCRKVVIENPMPFKLVYDYIPKPNHWVCPSQFGSQWTKFTCLWLKGVPPLMPTLYFPRNQTKSIMAKKRSPRSRSNTDLHLAIAMAEQWG